MPVPWLFFPEADGVELRLILLRKRPLRKTEGDREATLQMFYQSHSDLHVVEGDLPCGRALLAGHYERRKHASVLTIQTGTTERQAKTNMFAPANSIGAGVMKSVQRSVPSSYRSSTRNAAGIGNA